ncbi:uncharacterized protein LOC112269433 [Brachypodium distachyon]|uniref:Uncharacterized protein n=1 Tax=Brachypodium distachyon TaxID=15368 RepID=A0A2K2CEM5_BRADI|nr:uncharacterized protein LOC112269433 [Brachypodium distachyon]PNT60480.1 hypothetical protein BRADI_5g00447v3 [Brachypodium distachyon]|eukprot:XP_024311940.1 uncharacterized protein LOC112269433 [Brachypodium distachyon]
MKQEEMPPVISSAESLVLSASSSSSVNGRSPDHSQVISGDLNWEDEDGYAADFEEVHELLDEDVGFQSGVDEESNAAQEFEGNHVLPVVAPRFVIVQEEEAVVGDNFAHQADANLGEDLNE